MPLKTFALVSGVPWLLNKTRWLGGVEFADKSYPSIVIGRVYV